MVSTYDPFQVEQSDRTFKRLQELRAEGPIVSIGEGMYYVTSYEEARAPSSATPNTSPTLRGFGPRA